MSLWLHEWFRKEEDCGPFIFMDAESFEEAHLTEILMPQNSNTRFLRKFIKSTCMARKIVANSTTTSKFTLNCNIGRKTQI